MKEMMMMLVVAVALVVTVGRPSSSAPQDDGVWQQRLHSVDGYMQKGLSAQTHQRLATSANESADWVKTHIESFAE